MITSYPEEDQKIMDSMREARKRDEVDEQRLGMRATHEPS